MVLNAMNSQINFNIKLTILLLIVYAGKCNFCVGQTNTVQWLTLQELEIAQIKKPKKVIIEIYSKDCEWCKKFEREVLANPIITNYINLNFYLVKAELFDKKPVIFNSKKLLSTNGFHPITAEYLKGQVPISLPTQIFFDEKFTILNFLKGYNTPKNFESALHYFGGNHYQKQGWNEFLKGFQGQIIE
jgi:thioredoxin-related protein